MGVTGLWRLIEPAGKPVPVETLENKVLAVDISIWLHQMVKGYQDAKGAPLPNAHLIGLFQRLCKLLYFRIKPVFVFDGAFPDLKKETIVKRQDNKAKYNSESARLKRELAILLSKKTAIGSLLGKQISPKKSNNAGPSDSDDLFKLPALPQRDENESESDSEDEQNSSGSIVDLHSVDIESDNFKKLPVKDKYDLLVDLKETRKMNSWGKLHELPKQSDNFSDFQMQRLLKRRKVQECLEETEKEMGDNGMSLNDLESLLNEEGIDTKIESLPTRRIASNESTRFLLINNVKKALAEAKKKNEIANKASTSTTTEKNTPDAIPSTKDELEDDLEKAIKMSLECVNECDTSAHTSKTDDSWTSCLTDTDYSDSEEEDGFDQPDMTCAKAYIMQYSDFTNKAIENIVNSRKNTNKSNNPKLPPVDKIIEEINNETSVIVDRVDLSSDDCAENVTNLKITKCNNESIIELDQTTKLLIPPIESADLNATQSSVICLENPGQDIVTVDSSSEENEKESSDNKIESDTSNDEFEDVPEIGTNKTVVQLILNTNNVPDDDDIFADVFNDSKQAITKTISEEIGKTTIDLKIGPLKEPLNSEHNEVPVEIVDTKPSNNVIKVSESNKEIQQAAVAQQEVIVTQTCYTDVKNTQKLSVNSSKSKAESEKHKQQSDNTEESSKHVPLKDPITTEKLNVMVEEIQNEEQDLLQEKGRLDRVGRNITEQMTKEAQELLQIFGIPYIVAPMEAEAQCAFLETVNLTDGTITDDSDIWLFGGRTVYKNFFNQKKHVLQFLADRIEKSFNLNREKLVLLALLVGSDYTTGLSGVGPVTALEILASFPFNKKLLLTETSNQSRYTHVVAGLQEFKQWVRMGKRTDNINLKKKLKNVALSEDFPSVRVVQAYLEPNVEKSEDKFTWGELDLTILRDYTKAKFGWSQNKLDEIMKPVLSRRLERKSQKSVEDYFKRKTEFQSLDEQLSKRVKAAVHRLDPSIELPSDEHNVNDEKSKPPKKRKAIKPNTTNSDPNKAAGPSKSKQRKNEESVLNNHGVKVVSHIDDHKSSLEIIIPKSDRVQEIIPQREKDKHNLLQNKLKAIEMFRKTKIDLKKKVFKKKAIQPKEKAELSESSDSD